MKRKRKGFTILELILYISLTSIVLTILTIFISMLLGARVKNQAIATVEQQGTRVLQRMTRALRNAESIMVPLPGSPDSILSLDVFDNGNDPTVFSAGDGILYITEGGGTPAELTGPNTEVSRLRFTNLSRTGTPGVIRIEFVLSYFNPTGSVERAYAQTFYTSASLR